MEVLDVLLFSPVTPVLWNELDAASFASSQYFNECSNEIIIPKSVRRKCNARLIAKSAMEFHHRRTMPRKTAHRF